MTEQVSEIDSALILIDELDDFSKHASTVLDDSRREVLILSSIFDFPLYSNELFYQHLLDFASRNRHCKVKILIKDIGPVVKRGHRILNLARRLSSKIEIRKLLLEPKNSSHAYLMGDKKALLYKHDDSDYKGFVNYNAAVECRTFADEFMYLWEKHSELSSSLRGLLI